jgi:hypothetical protein
VACTAFIAVAVTAQAGTKDENATEAHVLAKQGARFFKKGQGRLAAELFKQAFKLDPDPGYLYSAARAEHQQGKLETAIETYEQVIRVAGPSSPFHSKSKKHLAHAWADLEQGKRTTAPPRPPPNPASEPSIFKRVKRTSDPAPKPLPAATGAPTVPHAGAVQQATPATTWKRSAGWTSLVIGALSAGSGAVAGAMAMTTSDALDENYRPGTKIWDTSKITLAEVNAKEREINSQVTTAWVLGGVGAVGLAAGVWMLATAPSSSNVALLPAGDLRGMQVYMRF